MKRKTFDNWMAEVESHLERLCSMSSDDMADCCYEDWYLNGVTPLQAAKTAIKYNQD